LLFLAAGKFIQKETFQKYLPVGKTLYYQPYEYPFRYMEEFRPYEMEARENKRGLWKLMDK